MPAIVTTKPLSVRFEFPDGTTWTARLDGLPNSRLAEDLAHGLPMLTHPLGGIGARATAGNYIGALRCMVRELTAAGFTGGADDLTRTVLIRYWMSVSALREADSRVLLAGYDAATGQLDTQVRAHLNGRALKAKPAYKPLAPYTEREWATLVDRCQSIIAEARSAQRVLLRTAEDGMDPRLGGLSDENLAWLLLRHGPFGGAQVTRWAGVTSYAVAQTNLGRVTRTLFPTTDVTFAYVLLFGAYTGVVPDGIADLGVSDIDWAGEATILLDYVKGRSGPQSLTLPRQAVRLLEQWLEHSAALRRVVGEQLRSQLWIRLNQGLGPTPASEAGSPASGLVFRNGLSRRWAVTHDLAVDGIPISLHRSRIRTTYQNLLSRRGWTGRTTIDPNHSPTVEGDHYLSVTRPAQQDAVEAIIEDGQAGPTSQSPATSRADRRASHGCGVGVAAAGRRARPG